MNKVIYATRFQPNAWGDGGHRRAAQIVELAQPLDIEVVVLQVPGTVAPETRIAACLRGRYGTLAARICRRVLAGRARLDWSVEHRSYFVRMRCVAYEWAQRVRRSGEKPPLVLVDDPIYVQPLVRRLTALDIPVVACCHNIETLSRRQVVTSRQQNAFSRELKLLGSCSGIITISLEETFLLSTLGMDAYYLPYYPGPEVVCVLQEIRSRRQQSRKQGVLLLGTALNKAT